jgi:hypothetical protein
MATKEERRTDAVSPEQLLAVFARGRIFLWMTVAVLIHVAVIGATSLTYIRDTWIDKEGARIRKETAAKALADAKAKEKRAAMAADARASSTNAPGAESYTNATPGESAAGSGRGVDRGEGGANVPPTAGDDTAIPASRTNSALVQKIQEVASSNEIPAQPSLGINLEDTNH